MDGWGCALSEESLPYRHGIHEAMGALSGQWVTAVLASLTARPMTYSKLLEHINRTEERLGWGTPPRPRRPRVLTPTPPPHPRAARRSRNHDRRPEPVRVDLVPADADGPLAAARAAAARQVGRGP